MQEQFHGRRLGLAASSAAIAFFCADAHMIFSLFLSASIIRFADILCVVALSACATKLECDGRGRTHWIGMFALMLICAAVGVFIGDYLADWATAFIKRVFF